jgi:DNA-3-methyladenine glycosylase
MRSLCEQAHDVADAGGCRWRAIRGNIHADRNLTATLASDDRFPYDVQCAADGPRTHAIHALIKGNAVTDISAGDQLKLPRAFYARSTLDVARDLIGKTLYRQTRDGLTAGVIVETEAYIAAIDPAAHGYRGKTLRNAVMFGPPGRAYVYFTYGMHYCLNVVTEDDDAAAAVLLRALEPTVGLPLMRSRRGERITDRDLARGPGRLCAAMALTVADNGLDLQGDALWLAETPDFPQDAPVVATPRIGITQAADWPWRFVLAGSRWVSGRKFAADQAEVKAPKIPE